MIEEIKQYINEVGNQANLKKKRLGLARGISEIDMERYISESDYRKERKDISSLNLKWFRKTKNQDLKDKLTIEGIKKGYSVRAETTMGALPEYRFKNDQKSYNRFDLSWEKTENSRDFVLVVEIEMDLAPKSIFKDFKKLTKNNCSEFKTMICQTKTSENAGILFTDALAKINKYKESGGKYLLSVWVWEIGQFKHYDFPTPPREGNGCR